MRFAAVVALLAASGLGCSPTIPDDGSIRCADPMHTCPPMLTCWLATETCHRGPEPDAGFDSGPPPDVGPLPDVGSMPDTPLPPPDAGVGFNRGNPCGTPADCTSPDTCVAGVCIRTCTMGVPGGCPAPGYACVPPPMHIGGSNICAQDCRTASCTPSFQCDPIAMMRCLPDSWIP